MTAEDQLELLESLVALRIEQRTVSELVRQSLVAVDRRLVAVLPALIRKRVAARLLGVSVQALDRWVARGDLPAEPIAEGARRSAIPIGDLLDLAVEVAVVRREAAPGARVITLAAAARARRHRLTRELLSTHNLIVDSHILMAAARTRRQGS